MSYVSFFVLLITIGASFRLFRFSEKFTSELPYMDQWDVLRGYFDNYDLWSLFRIQHGSHRQGIGAIIDNFLMKTSGMNLHWETRFMVLIFILNTILALLLVKKIGLKKWTWSDCFVPLLFLNLSQYEIFAGAPNPSHGALPQTFILLIALSFFVRRPLLKAFLQFLLLFMVMHTGYGYFAVFAFFALTVWDLYVNKLHNKTLIKSQAFVMIVCCMAIFLIYYIPYAKPMDENEAANVGLNYVWKIPFFAAGIVSRGLGASRVNFILVPSFLILCLLTTDLIREIRNYNPTIATPRKSFAFILLSVLLFLLGASWGRAPSGMGYSITSRYVPYVSLLLFCFYLLLKQKSENKKWLKLMWAFVIFYSVQELRPRGRDLKVANEYFDNKQKFIDCYLQKKDFLYCNDNVYSIYSSAHSDHVVRRLEWMDENKLGFFRNR
jgi:hypothetical protein